MMAQSKVWLITSITVPEYSSDREQCWLKAAGHRGEKLTFSGVRGQMINILALQSQQLPVAVMADAFTALLAEHQIPHTAMLGILPVPAAGLQSLIDSGQADEWLARQSS